MITYFHAAKTSIIYLLCIIFFLSLSSSARAEGILLVPSPSGEILSGLTTTVGDVWNGNPDAAFVALATNCPSSEKNITFYISGSLINEFSYENSSIQKTVPRDTDGNAFITVGSAIDSAGQPNQHVSLTSGEYYAIAKCGGLVSNTAAMDLVDPNFSKPIIEVAAKIARDKRLQKKPVIAKDFIISENKYASVMAIRCTTEEKVINFVWDTSGTFTSKNRIKKGEMINVSEPGVTPAVYEAKVDIYFPEGVNHIWYECNGSNVDEMTVVSIAALADGPPPSPPAPPCAVPLDAGGKCTKIDTAIGPIETDPQGVVKTIFAMLLSLSGGVAVLLIMLSGYQLMTSKGNPDAVKAAKERLTSALIGFLFLLFSLIILEVIGVDILQIPGLTR